MAEGKPELRKNNDTFNNKNHENIYARNIKSKTIKTYKLKLNDNKKSKANNTGKGLDIDVGIGVRQFKDQNSSKNEKSMRSRHEFELEATTCEQNYDLSLQKDEKYTPERVSRILCSVNNKRRLGDDQMTYIINFLNELKFNDLAVLEYNLQLIKAVRHLNDNALYCLLTLLLKPLVKWSTAQINLVLHLYYDLENSQKQNHFQPEMIMHTHVERLCPYQMAYFYDCMLNSSWPSLTSQRYNYLIKFFDHLKEFNISQANDYFAFLRQQGFIKSQHFDNLSQFLNNTKNQWKPSNYEKLETILKQQLMPNVTLSVANKTKTNQQKNNNKKRKKSQNKDQDVKLLNHTKSKTIVHHQDTQTFSQTLDYLVNGGLLKANYLNILNSFIQELLNMNHDENELINYLTTLKCRRVLNNAAVHYLKILIQEKIIPLNLKQRDNLLNALEAIADKKIPRILTVSLLNLKSRSNLLQKLNCNSINLATTTTVTTAPSTTPSTTPIDKMQNDVMIKSKNHTKEVQQLMASDKPDIKYLQIGKNSPPKMSETTRQIMKCFFYRLKVAIYFMRRLKYYQNTFKSII